MTIQAENMFREFVRDGIDIGQGPIATTILVSWEEESDGKEI
jgi:hypothetical protein